MITVQAEGAGSNPETIGPMSARELDAAGIRDPQLRASYETCRRLNARHGRTYYLSTLLLPAAKRPYVHALYGFARYADELVDSFDHADPDVFLSWSAKALDDLARGRSDDPITRAMVDTVARWHIPHEHVEGFLRSMRQDLTVSGYSTYDDLRAYMHGSAAVIGLEMVPILEPLDDTAYEHAAALGEAFQLTNFIRDVGEDLRRGRVYLPREDLHRFGVTRGDLAAGVVTDPIRALLRFQIQRTHERYAFAREGIPLLHPTSRDCIATAVTLYGELLDAVEQADYQVMTQRVRVPISRRLQVAVPGLVRSRAARRREQTWQLAPTPPLSR